jgi:hypothetical protein
MKNNIYERSIPNGSKWAKPVEEIILEQPTNILWNSNYHDASNASEMGGWTGTAYGNGSLRQPPQIDDWYDQVSGPILARLVRDGNTIRLELTGPPGNADILWLDGKVVNIF